MLVTKSAVQVILFVCHGFAVLAYEQSGVECESVGVHNIAYHRRYAKTYSLVVDHKDLLESTNFTSPNMVPFAIYREKYGKFLFGVDGHWFFGPAINSTGMAVIKSRGSASEPQDVESWIEYDKSTWLASSMTVVCNDADTTGSSRSTYYIAGGSTGSGVAIVVFLCCIYFCCCRNRDDTVVVV